MNDLTWSQSTKTYFQVLKLNCAGWIESYLEPILDDLSDLAKTLENILPTTN